MSAATLPERLLSREEAAKFLNISTQTLAHWASSRRVHLPFVRVGRFARYRRADLEAFIERNLKNADVEG
jgi:excisionase family DNA binding protein